MRLSHALFLAGFALAAVLSGLTALPARAAEAGDQAGTNAKGTPAELGVVPDSGLLIKRYKRTPIFGLTEYKLPPNCGAVNKGAWTLNSKPKYGEISFGTTSGHLANGQCHSHVYAFATVYYTWTRHSNEAYTDRFTATWRTPDGIFREEYLFHIQVPVVRPKGDTTVASGWDGRGLGLWSQTLIPPATDPDFDWSFDSVKESAPGKGGPDTCHFDGSAIPPFEAITGGTWYPDEKGKWEFDHVGWYTSSVAYYRKHGRAPCGTTFPQQMQHKAQPEKGFTDYGDVHTLGGKFTNRTVTSIRAGKSEMETR